MFHSGFARLPSAPHFCSQTPVKNSLGSAMSWSSETYGTLPKLENGVLDVTPVGGKLSITESNAKQSPLLRLPRELRNMIWEYALSGYLIKIYSEKLSLPIRKRGKTLKPRFSLLQVSRQVYYETALLPIVLSKLSFASLVEFRKYAISGRLERSQSIKVGALFYSLNTVGKCEHWFPLVKLPSLQSLDITLCGLGRWDGEVERPQAIASLGAHLEGKELNILELALFQTWLESWRDSEDTRKIF